MSSRSLPHFIFHSLPLPVFCFLPNKWKGKNSSNQRRNCAIFYQSIGIQTLDVWISIKLPVDTFSTLFVESAIFLFIDEFMSKFMQNIGTKMLNFRFVCQFSFFIYLLKKKNRMKPNVSEKVHFSYLFIFMLVVKETMHDSKQIDTKKRIHTATSASTTRTMQSENFLIYLISFDNDIYSSGFGLIRNIVLYVSGAVLNLSCVFFFRRETSRSDMQKLFVIHFDWHTQIYFKNTIMVTETTEFCLSTPAWFSYVFVYTDISAYGRISPKNIVHGENGMRNQNERRKQMFDSKIGACMCVCVCSRQRL